MPSYGALSASSTPQRNGSDISLDLTPLVAPQGGACAAMATSGATPADGHASTPPRRLSRLERVVLEIVETEQAYVRDLKSIVEVMKMMMMMMVVLGFCHVWSHDGDGWYSS